MACIRLAPGDGEETHRLFTLVPNVGEPAAAVALAIYERSTHPVRLRELMRMRIAQINECHV